MNIDDSRLIVCAGCGRLFARTQGWPTTASSLDSPSNPLARFVPQIGGLLLLLSQPIPQFSHL